jgi:anti-sigma factor RsiW
MNSTGTEQMGREQRDLNAYHDGELKGLRLWAFERRLSSSPRLRAELEELRRVARWVQASDSDVRDIDVWDDIALRLHGIDAERSERPSGQRSGLDWLVAYVRPISAVAVMAALALALFLGIMDGDAPTPPGMIRWLDTGGRSVMVLEDEGDATIVWLLEAPEEGAAEGGSREAV